MFIYAQRLNCFNFVDKVGFACFPERIMPIFRFFNRNQKACDCRNGYWLESVLKLQYGCNYQ